MKLFIFTILTTATLCFSVSAQRKAPEKTSAAKKAVPRVEVKSGKTVGANLPANKLSDEDLIRQAVFKSILTPWANSANKELQTYYLSVDDGKDPSENLLKTFNQFPTAIRKASESFISKPEGSVVLNKKTKRRGILFSVSKINWKNRDEAVVSAGSYEGNMGSDGCAYTLKRESDGWKIVSKASCYIS